jgi:hypothetical protein
VASSRSHYAESLRAFQGYGDRYAIAFLLEDIGVLAASVGDARSALELMGVADALREAIGTPRAPSLEEELDAALGSAVANTSAAERMAHRERGRSLELNAAIALAQRFCEVVAA